MSTCLLVMKMALSAPVAFTASPRYSGCLYLEKIPRLKTFDIGLTVDGGVHLRARIIDAANL